MKIHDFHNISAGNRKVDGNTLGGNCFLPSVIVKTDFYTFEAEANE